MAAMDNSHKLWPALTGYQEDDAVTIDNNAVKIQMPPWGVWSVEMVVRSICSAQQ
jgi:hypothetical protein